MIDARQTRRGEDGGGGMSDQDTQDRLAQFDRSIARAEDNLSVHRRAVRRTEDILDDLRRQRAAIAAPIDNDTRKDQTR